MGVDVDRKQLAGDVISGRNAETVKDMALNFKDIRQKIYRNCGYMDDSIKRKRVRVSPENVRHNLDSKLALHRLKIVLTTQPAFGSESVFSGL